jgi:hypothetical protein
LEIAVAIQYLTPSHLLVVAVVVVEHLRGSQEPTEVLVEVLEGMGQVLVTLRPNLHHKEIMVGHQVGLEVLLVLEAVEVLVQWVLLG